MQQNEYWKQITGFRDYYYVSNLGRLKRESASYLKLVHGVKTEMKIQEKILGGTKKNKKGYFRVNLRDNNGKSIVLFIHTIVAEAFLGKKQEGWQVNHINGIKTDNSIYNLEYVTNQQNRDHAVRMGLHATRKSGLGKLTLSDVEQVREMARDGETQRSIAKKFGVCQQSISKILRG